MSEKPALFVETKTKTRPLISIQKAIRLFLLGGVLFSFGFPSAKSASADSTLQSGPYKSVTEELGKSERPPQPEQSESFTGDIYRNQSEGIFMLVMDLDRHQSYQEIGNFLRSGDLGVTRVFQVPIPLSESRSITVTVAVTLYEKEGQRRAEIAVVDPAAVEDSVGISPGADGFMRDLEILGATDSDSDERERASVEFDVNSYLLNQTRQGPDFVRFFVEDEGDGKFSVHVWFIDNPLAVESDILVSSPKRGTRRSIETTGANTQPVIPEVAQLGIINRDNVVLDQIRQGLINLEPDKVFLDRDIANGGLDVDAFSTSLELEKDQKDGDQKRWVFSQQIVPKSIGETTDNREAAVLINGRDLWVSLPKRHGILSVEVRSQSGELRRIVILYSPSNTEVYVQAGYNFSSSRIDNMTGFFNSAVILFDVLGDEASEVEIVGVSSMDPVTNLTRPLFSKEAEGIMKEAIERLDQTRPRILFPKRK